MQKAFDKIQTPYFTKTLSKLGIKENFLNFKKKDIYENDTANIILMPSFLVSGIKQGYTFLFSLILEALDSEIMQEKEVQVIHIGRKSKTADIFSVTTYIENPKKKNLPKNCQNKK